MRARAGGGGGGAAGGRGQGCIVYQYQIIQTLGYSLRLSCKIN